MKNEQIIQALEIELTELTHKVDALQEKVNLEASQENHEINFLKNEIEQFAKKLAELKSSEEPITEIDKKMLFDFGQQMVKYLDGIIVDCEQETYSPEYNNEEFEVTWNNRVELRNVDVDVTEVIDAIKYELLFNNVLEYLECASGDLLQYVLKNKNYFSNLTDEIFDKFKEVLPRGFYSINDCSELEVDLSLRDSELFIESLETNFEDLIMHNLDQTTNDLIDELIPNPLYEDDEDVEENNSENN
jgi:hypothetical protein